MKPRKPKKETHLTLLQLKFLRFMAKPLERLLEAFENRMNWPIRKDRLNPPLSPEELTFVEEMVNAEIKTILEKMTREDRKNGNVFWGWKAVPKPKPQTKESLKAHKRMQEKFAERCPPPTISWEEAKKRREVVRVKGRKKGGKKKGC